MSDPLVSIVVPAYNEGEAITVCLERLLTSVRTPCEILVVYDTADDTTAAPVARFAARDSRVRGLLNDVGRGPAGALRAGFLAAHAPVVVVTMADGSDDVTQIDRLALSVERGAVIASASRYMRGGRQIGGPRLKRALSRVAGISLNLLAQVGTRDATNSFKAYSRAFVEEVGIASDGGFEMGIELVAKAKATGSPVVEIPTVWRDRTQGQSNFKMRKWVPRYLHWYLFAVRASFKRQRVHKRSPNG